MAWAFSDEIHALTGYDADSTGTSVSGETFVVHTNQWLTDGAKEIINNLPQNLQKLCAATITFTANSQAAGSESETLNTGKVFNVFAGSYNCRLIPNTDKYKAEDSGDFLYATTTDPAYYIEANKINVLPAGISNSTIKYEEVAYPTVESDDTVIAVFPDEAEHFVVLYAAMKALQYRMQIKKSDLPSLVIPAKPIVPTLSSQSVTITGTAPTFVKPAVAPDFSQVNTYIDTDEDIELASAKLQEISTQLSEYQADIQNEQIEFNKENVEYQAKLQKDVADAQFADANEARKLQKYQTELGEYSAEVNSKVQEFTQNLQKHTTDYQWMVNQYGVIKADYQQGIAALKGT